MKYPITRKMLKSHSLQAVLMLAWANQVKR